MDTVTRFDPRISGLSQQVKDLHDPQLVYMAKARDVRAEYIDGALHLYRHEDILAVNKHPDVLGNGGRGGVSDTTAGLSCWRSTAPTIASGAAFSTRCSRPSGWASWRSRSANWRGESSKASARTAEAT